MQWKRKTLHVCIILMLIFEMMVPVSCREFRGSSDTSGVRSRSRINKERERARLLRRLLQSSYSVKRSRNRGRQRWSSSDYEDDFDFGFNGWERETIERIPKNPKRFEINVADTNFSQSCCPQRFEIIEPTNGRNRVGLLVDLYQDDKIQQRFYELICEPEVLDKPCRFLEGRNQKMSKCTQQTAYTYALVQSNQSVSGWSLDHIRIRSGCACKLFTSSRKKKFNPRGK